MGQLFDPGPLLTGEAAGFVASCRVMHLGTVSPDGAPHVVPISPVLDLDSLVFATEANTVKVRNLWANPTASLSADAYDEDWSKLRAVVVYGRSQIIEAGYEWERGRTLLYEKYPQYPTDAAIELGSTVIVDVRIDRVVTWGF